eukprot:9487025-Pyramimonas_sp.AAC.1
MAQISSLRGSSCHVRSSVYSATRKDRYVTHLRLRKNSGMVLFSELITSVIRWRWYSTAQNRRQVAQALHEQGAIEPVRLFDNDHRLLNVPAYGHPCADVHHAGAARPLPLADRREVDARQTGAVQVGVFDRHALAIQDAVRLGGDCAVAQDGRCQKSSRSEYSTSGGAWTYVGGATAYPTRSERRSTNIASAQAGASMPENVLQHARGAIETLEHCKVVVCEAHHVLLRGHIWKHFFTLRLLGDSAVPCERGHEANADGAALYIQDGEFGIWRCTRAPGRLRGGMASSWPWQRTWTQWS